MTTTANACLAVIFAGLLYGTRRLNPLRAVAMLTIRALALGYLSAEMLRGAWARRGRWRECLERARMEI